MIQQNVEVSNTKIILKVKQNNAKTLKFTKFTINMLILIKYKAWEIEKIKNKGACENDKG